MKEFPLLPTIEASSWTYQPALRTVKFPKGSGKAGKGRGRKEKRQKSDEFPLVRGVVISENGRADEVAYSQVLTTE